MMNAQIVGSQEILIKETREDYYACCARSTYIVQTPELYALYFLRSAFLNHPIFYFYLTEGRAFFFIFHT